MSDVYNTLKALHLIFVITWFAGLFYIPRLFIYLIEAKEKSEEAQKHLLPQLQLMIRRLWYIITWPSAILATLLAISLLYLNPDWLSFAWMHVKLGFVVLLWIYHIKCHQMAEQLMSGVFKYSSKFMRMWNEGATLLLFAIIFIVIFRSAFNWIYGLLGFLALGVLLMIGIKAYKRYREKHPEK